MSRRVKVRIAVEKGPNGVSPSNRGETVESLYKAGQLAGGVGVDTIGIVFPIDGVSGVTGATASTANVGTLEEVTKWSKRLEGGGFVSWGLGDVAWAEASIPKRLNGQNVESVSVDRAVEGLEGLFEEAGEIVRARGTLNEAKLSRLDVCRDFDEVEDFEEWAVAMSRIVQPGRSKVVTYRDGELNNAFTLRIGPKTAWGVYTYDKHAETKGLADVGRIRFEARCRRDMLTGKWAQDKGPQLVYVGHLREPEAPATIAAIARGMWQRTNMDREVVTEAGAAAAIAALPGLTAHERCMLLGYLTFRAEGVPQKMHRHTIAKYEALARKAGVVVAPRAAAAEGSGRAFSLDFATGRQLLRAVS